jgi:hypothetical protein
MTVMRFTADAGLLLDITGDSERERVAEPSQTTVVVPARDDERTIGACLASVLSQRGVDVQVIVVDGGSADGTREVVRSYMDTDPRVELLACPGDTTAQLLNVGLWAANGRWLVHVDPRSTIPQDYVRTLVDHLESGLWTGAGGRDAPAGATPIGKAIAAATAIRSSSRRSVGRSGRGESVDRLRAGGYPTSLLRAIGGWDERLVAGEDVEINHRLRQQGYRLMVDPGLSVSRRSTRSLGDLFEESRAKGRGIGRLLRFKTSAVGSRDVLMPALLCLMVLSIPVAILSPTVTMLTVATYLAATLATSIPTARRLVDPLAKVRIPLALALIHAGTAVGAMEGMARPTVEKLRALIVR